MFASQLLRILQTVPADVNYETSAFDTCESKLTMKENQIGIFCHSNSYQREADPLSFSSSDSCHTNGYAKNSDPLAFGIQDGHNKWNNLEAKYSDVLDNCIDSGGLPMVGDQDGIFCNLNGGEKGVESLAPDRKDKDEIQSTPKIVHSMMDDEVMSYKEKESGDLEMPCTTAHSNMQSYTDKTVMECLLPELVVCYKEPNFHVVKDICVDEGMPVQEKFLIESGKDDLAGSFVSQHPTEDMDGGTTNRGLEIELHIPDRSKDSSIEDIKDNSGVECGVKDADIVSSALDGSKSSAEDIACKNLAEVLCPETLALTDEVNCTDKAEDDISERESTLSSPRVSQDFLVQDSLKGSSNFDRNHTAQQPDEIPPIEAILESLAVVFTSEESKKYGPVSNNLCYNSNVDGGTITFDFNSPKPAVAGGMDGPAEIIDEKAPKSEDLGDTLAAAGDQSANGAPKSNVNVLDQNPVRQDLPNHESWNSGNLLGSSQVQLGEGETSFSASGPVSGLITYSGPIAYSGSISLRSDSSTTSVRSFAFPVLQSEWNSSPVRMRKADRKHLRKHRGWVNGLFCCRF